MWEQAVETAMEQNSAPGYLYALAYSLAAILYVCHNPRRLHGVKLLFTQAGFLMVIVVFSYLTDTKKAVLFLPVLLTVMALVFLQLWSSCRMPLINLLYFTLRSFALGELFASLEGQLFYYVVHQFPVGMILPGLLSVIALVVVLFAVVFWMEGRIAAGNVKVEINKKVLLQTLFITLGMYCLSNVSNLYQNTPVSSSLPQDILLIRTLVDMGCVLMLYAYHLQMMEMNRRLENEMLRQLMEAQYSSYQMNRRSVELIQQKYHDLKHQIAYLRDGMTSAEKLAHLDKMETEIQSFEALQDTGSKVLDTILSARQLQCQNLHITMNCMVDGSGLDFMDVMDLSALFGNTLDNAIESVSRMLKEEPRRIEVNVANKKGFVVITVGNDYTGELQFADGLPKTTKGDQRYHGFGTRSIQTTARKYGGAAAFAAEDGWFEVKVILPAGGQSNMAQ